MSPDQDRLGYLFQKYFDKTASPDEKAELARLIEDPANKLETMELFSTTWEGYEGDGPIVPSDRSEKMLQQILGAGITSVPAPVIEMTGRRKIVRVAVAAAVLILMAGGVWLLSRTHEKTDQSPVVAQAPRNVQPGSNGAILTLDDGQNIVLDSVHSGVIARQGNTSVTKKTAGLVYNSAASPEGPAIFNTISTPKGRQYPNLTLEDGTKVWLDAGSSIRFPVVFREKERRVEITGQVWFDVVHNEQRPFRVMAHGVEIEDIGTQFNVKAYDDEKTRVTLVQGAVSIGKVLLKPGQQAQIPADGKIEVGAVDLDQVLAWKNGFFSFRNADIRTVMREVARWYDLEVVYEGADYPETFSGKIGRGLTLRDLLDGLAQTRVHYRIEAGKKLVIMP